MEENDKKIQKSGVSTNDPFLIAQWIAASLSRQLTDEEQERLEMWRCASTENEQLYKRVTDEENCKLKGKQLTAFDKKIGWEGYQEKRFQKKQKRTLLRIFRYAAAFLLPLGCALYFFINTDSEKRLSIAEMNVIRPGESKAILKLGSGRQIDLMAMSGTIKTGKEGAVLYNSGQCLTYNDTCELVKEDSLEYNEVIVPKCGEFQLQLSDGTLVYLNSMTKVRYPVRFTGDCREIELEGEAYFVVAKDVHKPFVVKTGSYDVTVLGTQFNISAYKDEADVTTTLVKGSVAVSGDGIGSLKRLIPNEQFVLNKTTGESEIKQVDVSYCTAWKDGKFRYRDVRLEDIMRDVERWYDVSVVYEDEEVKDYRFGFNMGRHEMIDPLLRIFELNGKIKIQKEGKVLKVKRDR